MDKNPEFQVKGLNCSENIILTEYAPLLFRNVRKDFVTEDQIFKAFIPSNNPEGMKNFKTGGGKSPSFFFFTDDKKFMIKTLKKSEKEILLQKGFLEDYFSYLMKNPDSLLMKIFGIFELELGPNRFVDFLITENMINNDFSRIFRTFDLKGSLHGRETKIEVGEAKSGTGLKTLKDKNFIKMFKDGMQIEAMEKMNLFKQMELDSALLKNHNLIDYNVFLI